MIRSSLNSGWGVLPRRPSQLFLKALRKGLLFLVLSFVCASFSVPVLAQGTTRDCNFHDTMVKSLKDNWDESVVGMGINNAGALVELFISPEGETYTIVVVRPDGWACVVTTGKDWKRTCGI